VGKIETSSKKCFLEIINRLHTSDKSIDSVIFGCTEIGLLVDEKSVKLPIFDTMYLHVEAALTLAFTVPLD